MSKMTRYRGNPFTRFPFGELLESSFYEEFFGSPGRKSLEPFSEVVEGEEGYTLNLAVPGLSRDDLVISLADRAIKISYDKAEKDVLSSFTKPFVYHRTIPENTDTEKVSATMNNGILSLFLPKKVEASKAPKIINIDT
jgi:HSP20 family protein